MPLQHLVELSNRYGSDPEYVLAGGGNTSFKDGQTLWVKASGAALADITEEGFVKMDRAALNGIFEREYSRDAQAREAEVLRDMMAARCAGEEAKRPSVEALVHNLLPFAYVLHVHPPKVNGMTCGTDGAAIFARLFPREAVWIPQIMPGYTLAKEVKARIDASTRCLFLENHGVFIGGQTVDEIDAAVAKMRAALDTAITAAPDFTPCEFDRARAAAFAPAVRAMAAGGGVCVFKTNKAVAEGVSGSEEFEAISPVFSPDHMVYCNDEAVFIESADLEDAYAELAEKVADYQIRNNRQPKIVGLKGAGFYACGGSKKEADVAAAVFLDAVKIAVYAQSFGGAKPMDAWLVREINNWEAERYRRSVSLHGSGAQRLEGKIAVITGGAQGFGLGIAEEMAAQGAYVGLADLNGPGAVCAAKGINEKLGPGRAIGYQTDVTNEEQVRALMEAVALEYGGLDILVSNAGIVRPGGVTEMDLAAFELVTRVNYTAYFLCTKHAAALMKTQNRFGSGWTDIIQINSKSGLEGSNRNFAYAGSKFGGIGLTQSFAKELVEHRVKVNSVCPGNFLDGPLWCDPENGLFAQYLRIGKIAGAKTVDDVKRAYEAKVPMGRGCAVADVARAILYVVEQQYETGQAIPVTGGQNMLK